MTYRPAEMGSHVPFRGDVSDLTPTSRGIVHTTSATSLRNQNTPTTLNGRTIGVFGNKFITRTGTHSNTPNGNDSRVQISADGKKAWLPTDTSPNPHIQTLSSPSIPSSRVSKMPPPSQTPVWGGSLSLFPVPQRSSGIWTQMGPTHQMSMPNLQETRFSQSPIRPESVSISKKTPSRLTTTYPHERATKMSGQNPLTLSEQSRNPSGLRSRPASTLPSTNERGSLTRYAKQRLIAMRTTPSAPSIQVTDEGWASAEVDRIRNSSNQALRAALHFASTVPECTGPRPGTYPYGTIWSDELRPLLEEARSRPDTYVSAQEKMYRKHLMSLVGSFENGFEVGMSNAGRSM